MSVEIPELQKRQEELELRRIAGKTRYIEINERTVNAYREEFRKKGLEPEVKDYPQDEFHMVAKQKSFDALVDPSQGIKKIIESMIRQPITVFNKQGKIEVKDALYFNGNYYGIGKRGEDLPSAPFHEGSYKKPRLVFTSDPVNPYDSKTGERRGKYQAVGTVTEHYLLLSEDKKERRKQLEDIIQKATGTHTRYLENHHLHYRNPSQNNDHSGTHGGSFTWDLFCDLSLEELGELQNKNYYTERATGQIKDRSGARVAYDHSTKKVETTKDR